MRTNINVSPQYGAARFGSSKTRLGCTPKESMTDHFKIVLFDIS